MGNDDRANIILIMQTAIPAPAFSGGAKELIK